MGLRESNGRSAAYRSLHIDTSKEQLQLSDYPMPTDTPHYLHHTQVLSYLQGYIEHFGLSGKVGLKTEVTEAKLDGQGYLADPSWRWPGALL